MIEWITSFLQGIKELHIVFGFIGSISDAAIQFAPKLHQKKIDAINHDYQSSTTCYCFTRTSVSKYLFSQGFHKQITTITAKHKPAPKLGVKQIVTLRVLDLAISSILKTALQSGALICSTSELNFAILILQCSSSAMGPVSSASFLICSLSANTYRQTKPSLYLSSTVVEIKSVCGPCIVIHLTFLCRLERREYSWKTYTKRHVSL